MKNNEVNLNKMYEIDESFRELRSMINTYWTKYSVLGLGITHSRLISLLADHGPLRVSFLAERLHITCGAVTGLADKLIEEGLIVRKKDQSDRRVVLLELTEKGLSIVNELIQHRKKLMLHLFTNLSDEEIMQGIDLFTKLKQNMLSLNENDSINTN